MNILRIFLIIIYLANCLGVIVLAMMQTKDSAGASGAVMGSTTNNFFEKNKGRTKEGLLKKLTIIFGSTFALLTIILAIIYMLR